MTFYWSVCMKVRKFQSLKFTHCTLTISRKPPEWKTISWLYFSLFGKLQKLFLNNFFKLIESNFFLLHWLNAELRLKIEKLLRLFKWANIPMMRLFFHRENHLSIQECSWKGDFQFLITSSVCFQFFHEYLYIIKHFSAKSLLVQDNTSVNFDYDSLDYSMRTAEIAFN